MQLGTRLSLKLAIFDEVFPVKAQATIRQLPSQKFGGQKLIVSAGRFQGNLDCTRYKNIENVML